MTKSEFIQHLEAPHYVNGEDIVGLQEVIKDFPYCQSAQVLLAKAFQVSENLNFEKHLKKTAAYAANRNKLHNLLFESKLVDLPEKYESANTLEIPDIDQQVENKQPEDSVNEKKIIQETEEVPKDQSEVFEEDSFDDNVLSKQIIANAINSSILLEVSDTIPDNLDFIPKQEKRDQVQAEKEITEFLNDSEEHSFTKWLSFYKDESLNDFEDEKSNSFLSDIDKENQSDMIYFNNSSSLPARSDFYSPAKMARLSVQEDNDLITETLASIYADQGNYEKAIRAFEKLQLKYPEKRVYFAGRIKEIESKINTQ